VSGKALFLVKGPSLLIDCRVRFLILNFLLSLAISQVFADGFAPIASLLEQRCLSCHSDGIRKGGLSLATHEEILAGGESGGAIIPGSSTKSLLITKVIEGEMPQKGEALSADEIALLKEWVDAGAEWPQGTELREPSSADLSWWAFQPLAKATVPLAEPHGDWPRTPVDGFILPQLTEKQLAPNELADRRTLIRRLSYDLLGLPPTAEQVAAFESDQSPNAYERLVDRLLASPRFGEQWGRHWLDVIRFGESRGLEVNPIIDNAWPFRDYVIQSFNEDKPFDRLVREHLAGDVIGKGQPEVEVGTGFLVAGPDDLVGNQDPAAQAQIRANTLDDIVGATGSAFLGMTINCARCHDHKFDPILQADYYRMQSAFDGVHHGERPIATEEEQKAHEEARRPILAMLEPLQEERQRITKRIVQRTQLPDSYPLPKPHHYLTENRFEPIMAQEVRLTLFSSEQNANSPGGCKIDEFEVWSIGPKRMNIALTATAHATSKIAADNPGAYGPQWVNDGDFGRHWIPDGKGILTLKLKKPERVDHIVFSSDRPKDLAPDHGERRFIGDYQIDISMDGKKWTTVARPNDRPPLSDGHARSRKIRLGTTKEEKLTRQRLDQKIAQVNAQLQAIPPLPTAWAGNFSQPGKPTYLMRGGDPGRIGPDIAPASLSMLAPVAKGYEMPMAAPESERRLALAAWMVQEDNPLTPRVLVNRLWHYHFGTGIVDTPSDFGFMGGRPTHPELLDWLATRLRDYQWQMKPLHRLMVTSAVYRQSSKHREEAFSQDAQARSLWRFPPRRLRGEEIRDTLLTVSGQLDERMGGPGFRLYQYLRDNVATYVPLDQHGPETYRRAVYHQNVRAAPVDFLTDFDTPDCALVAPRRVTTTTPLQALTFMNHGFLLDQAALLGERLKADDPADSARRAFSLAFQRAPSDREMKASVQIISQQGLPAFCRALLNANELIYLD
jgi:hypothetical protein